MLLVHSDRMVLSELMVHSPFLVRSTISGSLADRGAFSLLGSLDQHDTVWLPGSLEVTGAIRYLGSFTSTS